MVCWVLNLKNLEVVVDLELDSEAGVDILFYFDDDRRLINNTLLCHFY